MTRDLDYRQSHMRSTTWEISYYLVAPFITYTNRMAYGMRRYGTYTYSRKKEVLAPNKIYIIIATFALSNTALQYIYVRYIR